MKISNAVFFMLMSAINSHASSLFTWGCSECRASSELNKLDLNNIRTVFVSNLQESLMIADEQKVIEEGKFTLATDREIDKKLLIKSLPVRLRNNRNKYFRSYVGFAKKIIQKDPSANPQELIAYVVGEIEKRLEKDAQLISFDPEVIATVGSVQLMDPIKKALHEEFVQYQDSIKIKYETSFKRNWEWANIAAANKCDACMKRLMNLPRPDWEIPCKETCPDNCVKKVILSNEQADWKKYQQENCQVQ